MNILKGAKESWRTTVKWLVIFAIVLLAMLVALNIFFSGRTILPSQIIGALIGACLTAIITMFLLIGQTESQENKDKAIKIHEQKIRVYSSFISSLWETLADEKLEDEELRELRGKVFNELIFYLHPESIAPFTEIVGEICKIQQEGEMPKLTGPFASLTGILQDDLKKDAVCEKEVGSEEIRKLWGAFTVAPAEDEKGELTEEERSEQPPVFSGQDPEVLPQTWHFNILDPGSQIKSFRNGISELSLIEYGEYWRTLLLEQVRKGDLVFAFIPQKKGGNGYHGLFEVIGTRVINAKEDELYQRLDGGDPEKISLQEAEKYDVYDGLEDGASVVSNIIVRPLAYSTKGVGNPGGVYRKTISRYWPGYAGELLKRFSVLGEGAVNWEGEPSFNTAPDKVSELARRFGGKA